MRKGKKFIISFLCCILLSGCLTIKQIAVPPAPEQLDPQPLQVTACFDIYQLRVDLVRQTTSKTETVTNSDGTTSTRTVTVNVPYHYLGVYLGNGIFLDANLNLSLDLIRLLNLNTGKNFTVVRKRIGFFDSDIVYKKAGDLVTIKPQPDTWGMGQKITLNENGAHIKGGFLAGEQDITEYEAEIVYDPHGIFGKWAMTRLLKKSNGAEIPGFWENVSITKNPDGSVHLSNYLKMEIRDKEIFITLSGIFGFVLNKYRLIMTSDRVFFLNEQNWGLSIEIYTDGFVVDRGITREVFKIEN